MSTRAKRETVTNARRAVVLLATLLVVASTGSLAHAGGPKDKAQIFAITAEGPEPVPGSWSTLEREEDTVHARVRSRIEADHAYTLWWVIFSEPENCSDGMCGDDDIFNNPADHSQGLNVPQIQKVKISALTGGGAVANPAGRWKLDTSLTEGELPTGERQILLAAHENAIFTIPGAGKGLRDAEDAEIHLVLLDHGPAHEDPELLEQQLTEFLGACNPDEATFDEETGFPTSPGSCAEVQFSVHK